MLIEQTEIPYNTYMLHHSDHSGNNVGTVGVLVGCLVSGLTQVYSP